MKSKWFTWSLLLACALCILVLGFSGHWGRKPEALKPALESLVETNFIIDTNSVLETVLASASDTVERLRLPLALPLDRGKVTSFTTGPVLMGRPSSLRSILQYEGGYEFRHQDSIVFELKTPGAEPGEPGGDVPPMPRNREAFIANAELTRLTLKQALVRLGHTNIAFMDTNPDFRNPFLSWGWSASWKEKNGPAAATVDVDPGTLLIKQYWLSVEAFGREPWPTTLTHSRSSGIRFRDPPLDCSSLEAVGVNGADAVALVRAILPEATAFCRALGPSFPSKVTEGDLDFSQCKATLMGDRIWLDLRLRSGVTVNYYRGLVYSAAAPDSRDHKPEEDGIFRRSPEYTDPVTISPEAAVAKVSRIVLRRLGLPRHPLGLDAAPDVELTMTAGSTNGLRRYLISWKLPETEEERQNRTWRRSAPESALSAEIDAVTGMLKRFYIRPSVLECPDPVFAEKSGPSLP